MKQVRTFKVEDYVQFNEFVKTHSPRGENGIKFNGTHLMVFYDEGEIMGNNDKIQSLRFELGKDLETYMEYDKQLREAIKIRDSFDFEDPNFKQSWMDSHSQCKTFRKMLDLQVIKADVCLEMLKELGDDIQANMSMAPDIGEDKVAPIVSPMQGIAKKK